jgi:hypothetical protein
MTKPMTIKSPSKAWAAVNPIGDVWHIDTMRRTKAQFAQAFFLGKWEMNYRPKGWRIVRVTVTPMKKGKQ